MILALLSLTLASADVSTVDPNNPLAVQHRAEISIQQGIPERNLIYISFTAVPEIRRKAVFDTLCFVLGSTSSQRIIERTHPIKINPTLYYIDMANLKWNDTDWEHVLSNHNPYGGYTILVRPDWLIEELTDTNESDSHYRLLYGGEKQPKTLKEFLAFWNVITDKKLRFGLIEGNSGVSVQGQRWLENLPIARGDAWGTKDVLKIEGKRDFLQRPDGEFKFDGSEWIIGSQKISLTTGKRGTLHYYLLTDGKENRVELAPGDLVIDHTRFKGKAQIRNVGSCISCHSKGYHYTTQNMLKKLIINGVDIYAKDKKLSEEIEAFHLGEVKSEIEEANKRYAIGVAMCNGLTPEKNNEAFVQAINNYVVALTFEDVCRELYVTPEFYKECMLIQKKKGKSTNNRLLAVIGGVRIPRDTWEKLWLQARKIIDESKGLSR